MSEGRLVAVVPAWNEEGAIGRVVDEIRAFDPAATSSSSTTRPPTRPPSSPRRTARPCSRLPFNVGIGGAVQTGFRYARDEGYEVAVRLDGDGQHDASELGKLLAPIERGDADLVIGSRFVDPGGTLPAALRAPHRDPRVRAPRLPARRAEGHRHDLRLRRAEPRRDRALRRRVPARLPGGGGDARRVAQRPTARAGAGRHARAPGGTSSITFVRSLYYIVKVMLALLVASLRRYPRLEAARR